MTATTISTASRLLAAFAALVTATSVYAQSFPSGTLRILVPVPPGGPLDLTARVLAEHLSTAFERPVIVENRPGSGTLLAARAVAQAERSGHTLLLSTSSLSSYSSFFKDPQVDMQKDLTFVSMVARVPMFLAVSTSERYNTVADLVSAAKSAPNRLNYPSYGNANRVMSELLNRSLGIQLTHIGYGGAAPAAQALMRGDVAYLLDSMSTLAPLLGGGKVKVLAVTEPARVPSHPQIPTLTEAGFHMPDFSVWYGLVGPAGMPADVTEKLSREVATFAKSPKARARLESLGFALAATTPIELRQTVLRGEEMFRDISRSLDIQPE